MAFLYRNKHIARMTDIEIIQDVLLTQNKIEADLRSVLARIEDKQYGNKKYGYYPVTLCGIELVNAFIDALGHFSKKLPDELKNIDYDIFLIWKKFEHFQYPPFSDIVVSDIQGKRMARKRLLEEYDEYSRLTKHYYDFFCLDNEEKYKKLFNGIIKEYNEPAPLTKDIFRKLKYENIIAMTYCGYGAMGEEGTIWVIDNWLNRYGVEINTFAELDTERKISLFHGRITLEDGRYSHPRWWASANTDDIEDNPIFKIKDDPDWYGVWSGGGGNYLFFRKELLDGINEYVKKNCVKVADKPLWFYTHRLQMLKYAINLGKPADDRKHEAN